MKHVKRILFIDDDAHNISIAKKVSALEKWNFLSLARKEPNLMTKIKDCDPHVIFLKDTEYDFARYKLMMKDDFFRSKMVILIVDFKDEAKLAQLFEYENVEIISQPIKESQFRFRAKSSFHTVESSEKIHKLIEELKSGLSSAESELLKSEKIKIALSIVTTYSHEINNPLTIALGNLKRLKMENGDKYPIIEKIQVSLERIAQSVSNLNQVVKSDSIELEEYATGSNTFLVKIKD